METEGPCCFADLHGSSERDAASTSGVGAESELGGLDAPREILHRLVPPMMYWQYPSTPTAFLRKLPAIKFV